LILTGLKEWVLISGALFLPILAGLKANLTPRGRGMGSKSLLIAVGVKSRENINLWG
jgi:hypothetical protein